MVKWISSGEKTACRRYANSPRIQANADYASPLLSLFPFSSPPRFLFFRGQFRSPRNNRVKNSIILLLPSIPLRRSLPPSFPSIDAREKFQTDSPSKTFHEFRTRIFNINSPCLKPRFVESDTIDDSSKFEGVITDVNNYMSEHELF